MNPEEFSEIIQQLRDRIDDAEANQDEEMSDKLRGVRSTLRAWNNAGGAGPLPHAAELQAWGIHIADEAGMSPSAAEAADGADGVETGGKS